MKVVLFLLADRSYYRDPLVAPGEIFCGPDVQNPDGVRTIRIPGGQPRYQDLAAQYPVLRDPDLVVVKADATRRNFIRGIRELNCRTLLLLGDTHHLERPISTMIQYAQEEQFELLTSEHDRHHLHWFEKAGFKNIIWLPCFSMNPYRMPPQPGWEFPLSFVGSTGPFHPYRNYILGKLQEWGYPLRVGTAPQQEAARIYNRSLISLNVSLNGDFNFRIFEILAAGGFLLTDRLCEASGLSLLFEEGVHYEAYGDEQELRQKLDYYLAHPEVAQQLAKAGYARFWERYGPDSIMKRLIRCLYGDSLEEILK